MAEGRGIWGDGNAGGVEVAGACGCRRLKTLAEQSHDQWHESQSDQEPTRDILSPCQDQSLCLRGSGRT
jgi:hypothetical protein